MLNTAKKLVRQAVHDACLSACRAKGACTATPLMCRAFVHFAASRHFPTSTQLVTQRCTCTHACRHAKQSKRHLHHMPEEQMAQLVSFHMPEGCVLN